MAKKTTTGGTDTAPGRGYVDAVTRKRAPTERAGRGVPDERRDFAEEREENLRGQRTPGGPQVRTPDAEEPERK